MKRLAKILQVLILSFGLFGALISHAQITGGFSSPIGDVSVPQVLTKVINWLLSFVAILAMLGLVWGAITFIISLGNESGIQRAKKIVLWSVIGLVIALLSFLIIQFVAGLLGAKPPGAGN